MQFKARMLICLVTYSDFKTAVEQVTDAFVFAMDK
jgi:hypothetical protein